MSITLQPTTPEAGMPDTTFEVSMASLRRGSHYRDLFAPVVEANAPTQEVDSGVVQDEQLPTPITAVPAGPRHINNVLTPPSLLTEPPTGPMHANNVLAIPRFISDAPTGPRQVNNVLAEPRIMTEAPTSPRQLYNALTTPKLVTEAPTGPRISYNAFKAPVKPVVLRDVWNEPDPNQPAPQPLPRLVGLPAPTFANWAPPAIPASPLKERAQWAAPAVPLANLKSKANWAPPAAYPQEGYPYAADAAVVPEIGRIRRWNERRWPIWKYAAAVLAMLGGVKVYDVITNDTGSGTRVTLVGNPPVSTPPVTTQVGPFLPETPVTIESVPGTTPAETAVPTTLPSETIPAPVVTTTTETTLPAPAEIPATPAAETAPKPLTLYEHLISGEASMAEHRGQPLGTLRLDKYCDDLEVFINNAIDYTNPEFVKLLSPEAQEWVKQLSNPNLTKEQRRALKDDIQQYGLMDANGNRFGDPIYTLIPDRTPQDETCLPLAQNPRATEQRSYGSTEANQVNDMAEVWQPIISRSEYGDTPGDVDKLEQGLVTYDYGHFTSQSAPLRAMPGYNLGDTITYSVDSHSYTYELIDSVEIDAEVSLPDLINFLRVPGEERYVLQTCNGDNDSRTIYIFVRKQQA